MCMWWPTRELQSQEPSIPYRHSGYRRSSYRRNKIFMFEAKRGSDLFKLRATLSICFYIIPAAHSRAKLFFVLKNILVGEKYLSCALACINPSEVDTCWPRLEMVIFVSCVWRPRARPGHSSSFVMSTDFDHLIIWTGRCLAAESSLTTTGDSAAKICGRLWQYQEKFSKIITDMLILTKNWHKWNLSITTAGLTIKDTCTNQKLISMIWQNEL